MESITPLSRTAPQAPSSQLWLEASVSPSQPPSTGLRASGASRVSRGGSVATLAISSAAPIQKREASSGSPRPAVSRAPTIASAPARRKAPRPTLCRNTADRAAPSAPAALWTGPMLKVGSAGWWDPRAMTASNAKPSSASPAHS